MYHIIHANDLEFVIRRVVAKGDELMTDEQWYEFCHYSGCHFPVVLVHADAPHTPILTDVRNWK